MENIDNSEQNKVYRALNPEEEAYAYFNQFTKEQLINYIIKMEYAVADLSHVLDALQEKLKQVTSTENKGSED